MRPSTSTAARFVKYLGKFISLLFFPVTVPIAVATNYRGAADRLAAIPGIRRGGGMLAGMAVLVYLAIIIVMVSTTATLALDSSGGMATPATNGTTGETPTEGETTASTGRSTPDSSSTTTPASTPSTGTDSTNTPDNDNSAKYDRLLADVGGTYSATAKESYNPPYVRFLGGTYNTERESVTLNFSIDSLDSIDRYERAVARTAGIYVQSHFRPETAYPEAVTFNYFRDGELNATAKIESRWMNQYTFGNTSPDSYAPMSYRTYVRAVLGTLKIRGVKTEFPHLLNRCESDEKSTSPAECEDSLRSRMPVRYYLPERTATGSQYTNIMGDAQPNRPFGSRQERLEFTTQQLEENITGTVSIEGNTPVNETEVWKDVDMRIRDVYLDNETIVVEQFTRSEVGDDSLPLRQNDVIGAKYGRLVVNYGAQYMPTNGVVVIKYTPDGKKYSKDRIPNYNAVGYINGDRSLVGLGLGVEIIEQYQDPGS